MKAIQHSVVRILGHPTTRKVVERPEIHFDIDTVFKTARKHHVALELDAHQVGGFDYHFGIGQARRGWLEKPDVLNTLPWSKFQDML